MGQIRWTERASFNLENIHTYIAKDSPFFATKFIEALIDAIKILENTPNCGRVVPELESYEFRELIYKGYRIVYRIISEDKDIEVLAIVHSSRDLKENMIKD
ncbi:MAG: type II toxin-antitoxin system RelE/ParE family toxin [Promethearchaeota archaeon]